MSQGRKDSNQENVAATPLDPANNASTGLMQQSEAPIDVSTLVIANEPDFSFFTILFLYRAPIT